MPPVETSWGRSNNNSRGFLVGITDSGVAFDTSIFFGSGNDFAVTPFNTTGGFHDYRLSIAGGKGSLFIDGNLIDTLSPGPVLFDSQNAYQNRVTFGDASGRGISETELAGFRFGTPAAVPEPGTLALLLAAGLGWAVRGHSSAVVKPGEHFSARLDAALRNEPHRWRVFRSVTQATNNRTNRHVNDVGVPIGRRRVDKRSASTALLCQEKQVPKRRGVRLGFLVDALRLSTLRRLIHAACFLDRIMQHAILSLAEPVCERSLVPRIFACLPACLPAGLRRPSGDRSCAVVVGWISAAHPPPLP